MIEAIFFDWGGVLGQPDVEYLAEWERNNGLEPRSIWKATFYTNEWEEAQVGRLDEALWWTSIQSRLNEMAGREVLGFQDVLRQAFRLNLQTFELARSLRKGYKVGIISNATLSLESGIGYRLQKDAGVDLTPNDVFEVIVNSARVGIAKPDAAIYELAAERFGVPLDGCVHIDDTLANVDGARSAGMQAIHFSDAASLAVALRELGVSC